MIASQVYYFLIYFFLLVFNIVSQLKKNIVMKKLLEKVYDYFSDALFGGKSATNF